MRRLLGVLAGSGLAGFVACSSTSVTPWGEPGNDPIAGDTGTERGGREGAAGEPGAERAGAEAAAGKAVTQLGGSEAGTQPLAGAESGAGAAGRPPTNSGCNDDSQCDDTVACTEDGCVDGRCEHDPSECACVTAADCDDGDPCTADTCSDGATCDHVPVSGDTCDDLDACTAEDSCVQGRCVGVEVDCDDGRSCTVDSCQEGESVLRRRIVRMATLAPKTCATPRRAASTTLLRATRATMATRAR
jgi:hypothetical protein